MRKLKKTFTISPIKPEIRTWYAFEGPLGDVIHNKRFFFAWKEGCLMGTYNTLEEAMASLTSGEARDTLILESRIPFPIVASRWWKDQVSIESICQQ